MMSSFPPVVPTIPIRVNNVLGFPFIFRGALDVHATAINEEMKLAATHALCRTWPRRTCRIRFAVLNGVDRLHFGADYLIPKPFLFLVC